MFIVIILKVSILVIDNNCMTRLPDNPCDKNNSNQDKMKAIVL